MGKLGGLVASLGLVVLAAGCAGRVVPPHSFTTPVLDDVASGPSDCTGVVASPDGRTLLCAKSDYTKSLHRLAANGEVERSFELSDADWRTAAFSRKLDWAITCAQGELFMVRLWSLGLEPEGHATVLGERKDQRLSYQGCTGVAMSEDGALAVTAEAGELGARKVARIRIFRTASGLALASELMLDQEQTGFVQVTLSKDARWIARRAPGATSVIEIEGAGDALHLREAGDLGMGAASIGEVAFAPDSSFFVSAEGPDIRVWRLHPGGAPEFVAGLGAPDAVRKRPGFYYPSPKLWLSPDAHWVVATGTRMWVLRVDLAADAPLRQIGALGHGGATYGADFSADGRFLLTGAGDEVAELWRLDEKGPTPLATLPDHGGGATGTIFLPGGAALGRAYTAEGDGGARLWDLSQVGP